MNPSAFLLLVLLGFSASVPIDIIPTDAAAQLAPTPEVSMPDLYLPRYIQAVAEPANPVEVAKRHLKKKGRHSRNHRRHGQVQAKAWGRRRNRNSNTAGRPTPTPTPSSSSPTKAPTSTTPTPTNTPAPAPAPVTPPTNSNSGTAKTLLDLVNAQRKANGNLPPLSLNDKLVKACEGHANWMSSSNVMSHTGANGSGPSDRAKQAGYQWSAIGENVARGQKDAAAVMDAWMSSPGHRANILNAKYKDFGAAEQNRFWCQIFAA